MDTLHSSNDSHIWWLFIIHHGDHFISLAQIKLSNISGTSFLRSFLCLLSIFKGNPSYPHPNEMKLCKTLLICNWHLFAEYQLKEKWANAIGHIMPFSTPKTPKLETNLPLIHLRPNSREPLHFPIQTIWEFFRIFEMILVPVILSNT